MKQSKGQILLVNPWIIDFAAYDFWIKPLGLLQIGSLLKDNGYKIELLDCLDRFHPILKNSHFPHPKSKSDGTGHFIKEELPKPELLKEIPRKFGRYGIPIQLVTAALHHFTRPEVIFVTSGMTYWYPGVHEMISILKKTFPAVPIVLGGIYATLCIDHAKKKSGADIVIQGDGKIASLKIADDLTGRHRMTSRYQEMDDFPPPLYDLYPELRSAALLTSTGCPYRCPFCASDILAGKYQQRNTNLILKEIVHLGQNRNVENLAFYDDALLYQKENHLNPLLRKVADHNLRVRFHSPNGIQPRELDLSTAQLMFHAGFQTIRLSFESASADRQKQMGFKVRNEDLISAVSYLKEAGFTSKQIGSYVLMGLPGQSIEEVLDSLLFVFKQNIKVSLASFSPIPGTKSWKQVVQNRVIPEDADPLITNNSVFSYLSDNSPYDTFKKLGTLTSIANGLIEKEEDPFKSSLFKNMLKSIPKRGKG